MTQLTYNNDLAIAFPGMLADLSPRNDVLSLASEEATSFPYGVAVVAGTDPDKQALLPTGAANLVGIAAHSHANEVGADDANLVDDERVFNVLHVGRIYVQPEDTLATGAAVFVRVSAGGGGSQLGSFRSDADTATALAATGVRVIRGGTSSVPAVLEIDPGASIA